MVWSITSNSVDDLGLHLIDSTVARMRTPLQTNVAVPAETLSGYVGSYALAPGFVIAASEAQGRLFVQATGQPRWRLWPESATNFYLRVVPAKVRFGADSTGAKTLTLEKGGAGKKRPERNSGPRAPGPPNHFYLSVHSRNTLSLNEEPHEFTSTSGTARDRRLSSIRAHSVCQSLPFPSDQTNSPSAWPH